MPDVPRNSSRNRFNDDYDQFENPDRISRRFKSQEDEQDDDYMEVRSQRRKLSRTIPESAVSRRRPSIRESNPFDNVEPNRRRNSAVDRMSNEERRSSFGERRSSRNDIKRGSRPLPNQEVSRKPINSSSKDFSTSSNKATRSTIRSQTSKEKVEDASFSQNMNEGKKPRQTRRTAASGRSTSKNQTSGRYSVGTKKSKPRDNSSRFDD